MRTSAPLSLVLLPVLALSASAAGALTLDALAGAWRGEGEYRAAEEPAERLRCRMRGLPAARGVMLLQGRCATAQAGQSFTWALTDRGDGRIEAEDRSPVEARDAGAPDRLFGRIGPEGLQFDTPDGGQFALATTPDGALRLVLTMTDRGQPVRAEARLQPEN